MESRRLPPTLIGGNDMTRSISRFFTTLGPTALALLAAAVGIARAGDPEFPGREDGQQVYLAGCAVCHGPDGDGVPAADLAHGRFRRASSDEELGEIIRSGIKGTAMPPNDLSQYEAEAVVEYLRYLAVTARSVSSPGNPGRGQMLFEGAGKCLSCHRVKDRG